MAEGTHYAYSTFNTEVDEWGQVKTSIKPGDEVSQDDLGVDDETWATYVETGVVSSVPYPECLPGESPTEAFAREDAAYAAGELDEEQAAAVEERQEAQKESSKNVHDEAAKLASAGEDEAAAALIEESVDEDEAAEPRNPSEPTDAEEPPAEPTQLPAPAEETSTVSRDYNSMTVDQLKTLAGKREIEGRGSMNKDDLVAALEASDKA